MKTYELLEHGRQYGPGSHTPIDVTAHWSIRNPLNVLLVLVLFVLIISISGLI